MTDRLVSVSLVTFNGLNWLAGCLSSLWAQQDVELEVLVADNASTDGTLEELRAAAVRDPRIAVVENQSNLGFAVAHNRNIDVARAGWVMLLNQDVVLDPGFLAAALRAFERRPDVAAVQGRLLRLGRDGQRTRLIDTTGLEMHRDRRVVARRQGEPEDERDQIAGPVWGVDGPAPVYRRSALLAAREPRSGGGWEVLDEDFFMYKEDVDLAWRLRNLGWRTWYEPAALAWHARGAGGGPGRSLLDIARSNRSISPTAKSLSWRNQRLMQVKNEDLPGYLRDLPSILAREILSLAFIIVADPRRLAAIPALAVRLPAAMRKRRHLLRRRSESRTQARAGWPALNRLQGGAS